jgi:hypothetical protein
MAAVADQDARPGEASPTAVIAMATDMPSTPRRRKQRRDPDREQVDTVRCSAAVIVDSPYFAVGVADLRAGAPPRFDEMQDEYRAHERGRQWAVLAPITMAPHSPMAIRLFEAAQQRGWII